MKSKDYEVDRNKFINFYNIKEKVFKNGEIQYSIFDYGIRTGEPTNTSDDENKIKIKRGESLDKEGSVQSSMNRTKSMVHDYSKDNVWEWFVTLTFNPEKVDRYNYEECTKKLSQWLKHLKARKAPELKYIIVPEYHEDKAFHFHGLFSNIGNMELIDAINPKTGIPLKDKNGNQIYNIGNYKLGWTTATMVRDTKRASSYILKYITKELCTVTFNKRRYWCSKNLDKPTINKYYEEDLQVVKDTLEGMAVREPREVILERLNNKVTFYQIKGNDENE